MIRKKDQHKSLAVPENEAKTTLERMLRYFGEKKN